MTSSYSPRQTLTTNPALPGSSDGFKMNPPEHLPRLRRYRVVFEFTEGQQVGTVVSFDQTPDQKSSLSSGCLADHSSLSESSELCFGQLPVIHPHDNSSSASTSNSSGLSGSKPDISVKAHPKPARCCTCATVPAQLRLKCCCGSTLLFAKDTAAEVTSPEPPRDPVRLLDSDMDLTDPIGLGVSPSLPKIQVIRSARNEIAESGEGSNDDGSTEEDSEEPEYLNWVIPDSLLEVSTELPLHLRPPAVPTHYVEDKKSPIFGMKWLLALLTHQIQCKQPPEGVTRVYHDPAVAVELPPELKALAGNYTEDDMLSIAAWYRCLRVIIKGDEPADNGGVQESPSSVVEQEGGEDESEEEIQEEEEEEDDVEEVVEITFDTASELNRNRVIAADPVLPSANLERKRRRDVTVFETASELTRNGVIAADPVLPAAGVEGKRRRDVSADCDEELQNEPKRPKQADTTLVYAKFDRWYYPGIIDGSVGKWNDATSTLRVRFYDSSEDRDVPADQMLPLERLPEGTLFQCHQGSDDDDVFNDASFISYTERFYPLRTAHVTCVRTDDGSRLVVHFERTALSPKDVVGLRSALKSKFYPTVRTNFTNLTLCAILPPTEKRSRRTMTPIASAKKPQIEKAETNQPASAQSKPAGSHQPTSASLQTAEAVETKLPASAQFETVDTRHSANIRLKSTNKEMVDTPQPPSGAYKKTRKLGGNAASTIFQRASRANSPPAKKKKVEQPSTAVVYQCLELNCGKVYNSLEGLEEHRRIIIRRKQRQHREMKVTYKCLKNGCGAIWPDAAGLAGHIKTAHQLPTETPKSRKQPSKSDVTCRPSTSGRKAPAPLLSTPETTDTDIAVAELNNAGTNVSGDGLSQDEVRLEDGAKGHLNIKGIRRHQIPPRTKLFEGHHFFITNGSSSKRDRALKHVQSDSESDSTDESYYATPVDFDCERLQREIECGGGKLHKSPCDLPMDLRKKPGHRVIVVSGCPCRTPIYLYGVATGAVLVRHDSIIECVDKGVTLCDALLNGTAVLLSPGWDDLRARWQPPRISTPELFDGKTVLCSLNEAGNFWRVLIRCLGGKPANINTTWEETFRSSSVVIADKDSDPEQLAHAESYGIPVVSTRWLVQAVILGKTPPYEHFPLQDVGRSLDPIFNIGTSRTTD